MKLPEPQSTFSKLNNLLYLSYLPCIINTAIDISLFDILSENKFTLSELTDKTGTVPHITKAMLNVLIAIDLVGIEDNRYVLKTVAKEYLVQHSEIQQISAVQRFSGSAGPFDCLSDALKGKGTTFNAKMWASEQAGLQMGQGAKAGMLQDVVSFISSLPAFKNCTKMCDFAGNIGYVAKAMLEVNPKLSAHVFDYPEVCQIGEKLMTNQENSHRISFQEMDIKRAVSFGSGFDLFFASHVLYEFSVDDRLVELLKKINRAMIPGGMFISNHLVDAVGGDHHITNTMVELMTQVMGYPTHQMPESVIKSALEQAGFGRFIVQPPNEKLAFPTLLLSAVKIKEV
ncbi:methyltransferase domain-containing protein [Marinilabiliaceae bacterium JC017]|nr:methyltransferase domain-containing protein [Marinilabiliaceae bacterium JC017]